MQSESMTFCRISKLSNIIVNAKSQNKGKLNVKKYNSHFPVVSVPEMWCQWLMWCQSLTWCLPESDPAAPQRELRQDAQTKVIEYWSKIMWQTFLMPIARSTIKVTFSHSCCEICFLLPDWSMDNMTTYNLFPNVQEQEWVIVRVWERARLSTWR